MFYFICRSVIAWGIFALLGSFNGMVFVYCCFAMFFYTARWVVEYLALIKVLEGFIASIIYVR